MSTWLNFFNLSLDARGTEDLFPAQALRERLKAHDGREAYHSAFDLEEESLKVEEDTGTVDDKGKRIYRYHAQTPETLARWPKTVHSYDGPMRPALGYAWFDFDSKDGGESALQDARKFVAYLGSPEDPLFFYSGSKGFHVGVPFAYFGLPVSPQVGKRLHALARAWKKTWPSLDTTVFNPQRKFRAVGSKHPKTGLFKIRLKSLAVDLPAIRAAAKKRGPLEIPEPDPLLKPLPILTDLLKHAEQTQAAGPGDSISLAEWRRYRQPEGTRAFQECLFLAHCRDNPASLDEPQWYAAASIVGRMKEGRAKFQAMSQGHPGYSVAATDEKLEQALQASGPRTCEAIEALWGGCSGCQHYQRLKSPVVILEKEVIPTEATGFYDLFMDGGKVKRVPNYADLLSAFIRETPYKTIADMKAVYAFKNTHYVETTPIEIKCFAESHFNPAPAEKLRAEFLHKVFANRLGYRSFFTDTIENLINFKNGILNTESGEMYPHSPDFGFRSVLPYNYDPKAECPTFLAWIEDVMLGDRELVAILQEYMGYVVRGGEYKYHKALWLSGSGRNGKSTFLDVLKALIGEGNYSTLSIRQIINDKFSAVSLDGKIANFSEETSPEELSDSGPFKNLTGDGDVHAQKKYGDPYTFRSRAKLIMTYNEVPQLKDLSPGMLSRPIIIPWKKDLTDESKQDKTLQKRLLAELPGIFNFAFEGWKRLEANAKFSHSEKSTMELEEVRSASCSATRWFKENVILTDDMNVPKIGGRRMYELYKMEAGQFAFSETKFGKRIQILKGVGQRRLHTVKGTEYVGLVLRSKNDKSTDF